MKLWKMLTKKKRLETIEEIKEVALNIEDWKKIERLQNVIGKYFPSVKFDCTGIGSGISEPNKIIFKFQVECDAREFSRSEEEMISIFEEINKSIE